MPIRYLSGVNVDSNTLVVDAANDRVGIGTASPGAKLHLSGAGATELRIASTTGNTNSLLSFYEVAIASWGIDAGQANGSFFIKDLYNSATRLTILNSGNVGIGTTSPANTLDIAAAQATLKLQSTTGTNTVFARLENTAGTFYIGRDNSAGSSFGFANAAILYETGANPMVFVTNSAERLRITSAGNVGIGTTSPGAKLDVETSAAGYAAIIKNTSAGGDYLKMIGDSGNTVFEFGSGGTGGEGFVNIYSDAVQKILFDANGASYFNGGNVGIGTTAPNRTLTVNGVLGVASGTTNVPELALSADGSGTYISSTYKGTSSYQPLVFETNGSEKVRITTGGNVGIGTTAPNAQLNITKTFNASAGAQTNPTGGASVAIDYQTTSDIQGRIRSRDWDGATWKNLTFEANNIILSPAGNVGIGTTSPSYKLDVNGATQIQNELILSTNDAAFRLYRTTGVNYFDWSSGQDLRFSTVTSIGGAGRSTAVTFLSTGNVGIGTTSPFNKLTVGSVPASGYGLITISADWASGSAISTGVKIGAAADTGSAGVDIRSHSNYAASSGTEMSFWTNSTGNVLSERMRITSAGNVGIGTTAPNEKLHVSGNVHAYAAGGIDAGLFASTSAGSTTIAIRSSGITHFNGGNVGIGTTSPDTRLHVWNGDSGGAPYEASGITIENSGRAALNFLSGAGNDAYVFFGNSSAGNAGYVGYENTANRLVLRSTDYVSLLDSTGEVVRIDGGNVGIGTTAPTALLTVAGTTDLAWAASTSKLQISRSSTVARLQNYENGSASTNLALQWEGGNVGIGTTSPGGKLQVGTYGTITAPTYSTANGDGLIVDFFNIGSPYTRFGRIISSAADASEARLSFFTKDSSANPTEKVTILGNGNVGIGTTSPAEKLHAIGNIKIEQTSNVSAILTLNPNSGALGTGYQWNLVGVNSAASYAFQIREASTAYLHINNSAGAGGGNVGIGTTSPATKLHVSGDTYVTGQFAQGVAVASKITGYGAEFRSSNASAQIFFGRSGDSIGSGGIGADETSTFIVWSIPSFVKLLVVNQNGNVGINTDAPSQKLHVAGNLRVTGAYYDSNNEAGTSGQVLTSTGSGTDWKSLSEITGVDGTGTANYVAKWSDTDTITNSIIYDNGTNVGIGTTSPSASYKLSISGSTYVVGTDAKIYIDNGGVGGASAIIGAVGTSYGYLNTDGPFPFVFQTNNSERMRITSAGNVGIGTTAPTAKLHVWNGGIKTSAFPSAGNPFTFLESNYADSAVTIRFQNINPSNELDADLGIQLMNTGGSITDVLIIKGSTGNVGIGTTSPSYKLTVDGDSSEGAIGIERTTVSANTVIGALNFTNNNAGTVYGRVRGGRNSAGDGYVSLGTGLGDSLYAVESGNIGIGTASPGAKLHNYSTATSNVFISGYGTAAQNDWGAEHAFFVNANNGIIIGKANAQNDTNRLYTFYNDAAGNAEQYIYNTSNTATIKLDSAGDTYFNGGNVGIGTTGPTEKLHVDGSTLITYNNSFQSTNSVGNKAILARVSPTSGIVNYAEYATATNLNGFVIGSDDARVKGNITGDSLEFITNTSTRMTVLSSGNVGINTTTPGSTLHVVGDVLIQTGALGVGVNPNATDGRIDASNDIVAFSTSDKRLKENITPIANALEKVRSLTGVEFDWKEETKSVHGYEGHDVGVIAQDVQAVLPEAVRTNDTGYLSVRYEKMIALLIEANKELASRVEQLEKLIK